MIKAQQSAEPDRGPGGPLPVSSALEIKSEAFMGEEEITQGII